jgi:glutathione synthase/RimK-type ligase-like ATP-grasp enzyme
VELAVAQAHREGDVYKFYGVGGRFFRAFGLAPEREAAAADLAARAARAVGLEVYGGDGIASSDGTVALVDLNDWPSFSRCRDDAAAAIAARLREIVERDAVTSRT